MILEELLESQNNASLLGLMLNVKPYDVEAIETTYKQPKDKLYHIILTFLRQSEQPTWRVIIKALKSKVVNLQHLAASLERAHFPDPNTVRELQTASGKSVMWKCSFY